jgi:hypothetical protein
LSVASVSERFLYILIRWKIRPKSSTTNYIGAKPRASGTALRSLPRHACISHSAKTRKYLQCISGKFPGPMLTCAVAHAMSSKRRGADGNFQAQFRPDVREASAGDVLSAQGRMALATPVRSPHSVERRCPDAGDAKESRIYRGECATRTARQRQLKESTLSLRSHDGGFTLALSVAASRPDHRATVAFHVTMCTCRNHRQLPA